MRAVIADDSRVERAQVRRMLQELGHEVVAECENGEQAIEAVKQHKPDIAILDVIMARMTGDAAALEIAKSEHVPAMIFATKNSQGQIQQTAKAVGAVLMVKPYLPSKVASAVEAACGNH